jgi:exonuclease VII large subunit
MISDSQIKKISFAIAIIGIIGVVVASNFTGPETIELKDLDDDKIGHIIEVSGMIASFSTSDGHIFIDLTDGQNKIPVVMFERTARGQKEVYSLVKGMNVTVKGKVLLYKNEIEIQADTIDTA